jgi:dynein heavy chain
MKRMSLGMAYRSLIASWLSDISPAIDTRARVGEIVLRFVEPCLAYRKALVTIVPLQDIALVQSFLTLLDASLDTAIVADVKKITFVCAFASIWAFGGALIVSDDGTDYRQIFSEWWRQTFQLSMSIPIPNDPHTSVFDYYLHPHTFAFDSWRSCTLWYSPNVKYEPHRMERPAHSMALLSIPTPAFVSTLFWSSKVISEGRGLMLCGNAGTGKTTLVKTFLLRGREKALKNASGKLYGSSTMSFHYYTNVVAVQVALESALVKQRPLHGVENRLGSNTTTCTYGPADAGCQWIYFLEDLNLPMVDTHGKTQPAVALVRQWLDYQHWHDTITFAQKKFVDCQFIVSMNPTAGSHTINPRLQRHLITLALGVPPETRYVMRLFRISIERGVVRI